MNLLYDIIFPFFLSQYATANLLLPFGFQNKGAIEFDMERSLICKLDAVLLACKILGAQATTFCISYLNIEPSTTVMTVLSPTNHNYDDDEDDLDHETSTTGLSHKKGCYNLCCSKAIRRRRAIKRMLMPLTQNAAHHLDKNSANTKHPLPTAQ
ncbi:hypothetical protein V8E51_001520 [Hyaloscypha variabilis]